MRTDVREKLPRALRRAARWTRLGAGGIPAMLVRPHGTADGAAPTVIWLHGRTAHKELDPGRYLRLMRAGLGVCAVDLPGHGERFDAGRQEGEAALEVMLEAVEEIDQIVEALGEDEQVDRARLGIGGMSAGGMAVLARLCRPHPFRCASVEATTGSWNHQRDLGIFRGEGGRRAAALDPVRHLDRWREIPFQAFHARGDELVAFEGQAAFIDALRRRYEQPELIDFVVFDRTGAPHEHLGFGRHAAEVKNRQRAFLSESLER